METESDEDETIEFEIELVSSASSSSSSLNATSNATESSNCSPSPRASSPAPLEPEETAETVAAVVSGEESVVGPASDSPLHSSQLQESLTRPPITITITPEEQVEATQLTPTLEYQLEELKNPISQVAQYLSVSLTRPLRAAEVGRLQQTSVEVFCAGLEPEIELQVDEQPVEEEKEPVVVSVQQETVIGAVQEAPAAEWERCDWAEAASNWDAEEAEGEGVDGEEEEEEEEDEEFPQLLHTQQVSLKRGHEPSELYELCEELGRGKFGYVYKCVERSTGRQFAAKFVSLRKPGDREDVLREIAIMSLLRHPRLLQLLDAFDEVRGQMCLITELIEGGELFERIVDDDFELTEQVAGRFMRQICEGVAYMHSRAIVHLDMKPENILCASRESFRVKLIDFGLARQLEPGQSLRVMFGTPDFAAPEVLAYEEVSLATDMWSVGVICYVLLSGLSPFMGDTDMETMANVEKAVYEFDEEAFAPISDEAKDFIARLLVRTPAKRMRPDECLEHRWLKRLKRPTSKSEPAPAPVVQGAPLNQQQQQQPPSQDFIVDLLTPSEEEEIMLRSAGEAFRRQSIAAVPVPADHHQHQASAMGAEASREQLAQPPERSYTLPLFISLDKRNLKRYVVRRKWHRSVHAIMALGRMGALLNRLS